MRGLWWVLQAPFPDVFDLYRRARFLWRHRRPYPLPVR